MPPPPVLIAIAKVPAAAGGKEAVIDSCASDRLRSLLTNWDSQSTATASSQAESDATAGNPAGDQQNESTAAPASAGVRVSAALTANSARGRGGRQICQEFLKRDDIGSLSICQANWGGERKAATMNLHTAHDIIAKSPANVFTAQEVDQPFIRLMAEPSKYAGRSVRQWLPQDDASTDVEELKAKANEIRSAIPWIVVSGIEKAPAGAGEPPGTCIVAARSSMCRSIDILYWKKTFDGTYKDGWGVKKIKREAYSRFLVAKINWKEPMMGQAATVVATVHMHRMTAKRATGFAQGHTEFLTLVKANCHKYGVSILTGDWNMSLWLVQGHFSSAAPAVAVKLAAFYAWVKKNDASTAAEKGGDEQGNADASAGAERRGDVRCDSCGIFILGDGYKVKLALSEESLRSGQGLPEFPAGQGYGMHSYLGGMGAAERTLQSTLDASAEAETNWKEHVAGKRSSKGKGKAPGRTQAPTGWGATAWHGTVRVTQKTARIDKFDPLWILFKSGAHMPLIVFVGNHSRRSQGALDRREHASSTRGWGPQSGRRSRLMQRQGYGPRPREVMKQALADAGWRGGSTRPRRADGGQRVANAVSSCSNRASARAPATS